MSKEAKIRKYQDIVKCAGWAIIAFGFWIVFRQGFYIYSEYESLAATYEFDPGDVIYKVAIIIAVALVAGLDILFRLFLFKSTIKVSEGHGKQNIVIVICIVLCILSMLSSIYDFRMYYGQGDINELIVIVLIDISSNIALIEIIISCLKLKSLRRLEAAGEIQ